MDPQRLSVFAVVISEASAFAHDASSQFDREIWAVDWYRQSKIHSKVLCGYALLGLQLRFTPAGT